MAPPTSTQLPSLRPQYAAALQLIDDAHAQDARPTSSTDTTPYELNYARHMTQWLAVRSPDASEVLQLACRAQHFRRWEIPRSSYPMTRPGYLTWRAKLKSRAADQVAELLSSPSIEPSIPEGHRSRIAALIRKEGLGSDPEVQALEDAACLVFLDDQFDDFDARKKDLDDDKMVGILKKTWGKMSEEGRGIALGMELSERAKGLITRALQE